MKEGATIAGGLAGLAGVAGAVSVGSTLMRRPGPIIERLGRAQRDDPLDVSLATFRLFAWTLREGDPGDESGSPFRARARGRTTGTM